MKRITCTISFLLFFSLLCINAAAQVEYVFSSNVTDDEIFIEALDGWFTSPDSKGSREAILLETFVNGDGTSTHTVVIDFPDYANQQSVMQRIPSSKDFDKYQRRVNTVATGGWEGMYLRGINNGKSYKEGDYIWVASIQVSRGENKVYTKAYEEMLGSKIGKQAPGLMRLMSVRAGSSNSHVAIFSAPTFVTLNEYLDSLSNSEEYEIFISKVKAISVLTDSSIYRVVKIWK
jgi:hypothetical protein